MDDMIIETIYDTVVGQIIDELAVPGVENLFAPGKECSYLYLHSREAYARLCTRLQCAQDAPSSFTEDHDLDIITDSLDKICRLVAFEMFRCGARFQKQFCNDSH